MPSVPISIHGGATERCNTNVLKDSPLTVTWMIVLWDAKLLLCTPPKALLCSFVHRDTHVFG